MPPTPKKKCGKTKKGEQCRYNKVRKIDLYIHAFDENKV